MRRAALAVLLAGLGCGSQGPAPPVTLRYQGVSFGGGAERNATARFSAETGIRVEHLPAVEAVDERLEQARRALEAGTGADVYLVDLTWPGVLAPHLLELPADLAEGHLPALAAQGRPGGRLVAVPAYVDVGVLFYRTDLLRKYGYGGPPQTWDALEEAAARIQAGERAAGRPDFWGWVWQGGAHEGLTCNALEWQASEGGGLIVEDDGQVSVDNPDTARALERAARWVGTISPPEVLNFLEEDARERWQAGQAAFMRNWPYCYLAGQAKGSPVAGRFEMGALPGGRARRAHTLGGWLLAAARATPHPREALELVRFLSGVPAQRLRVREGGTLPTRPALFAEPDFAASFPAQSRLQPILEQEAVARPALAAGPRYGALSAAYFGAVNAVLAGRTPARPALRALQAELARLTAAR